MDRRLHRPSPRTTTVVVVDVQERLAAAMPDARMWDVLRAARILIEGGRMLGARVIATEQYPKGLGPTVPEIARLLDAASAPRVEKLHFSAWGEAAFRQVLREPSPDDAKPADIDPAPTCVVLGMEAHVCVFQTVRDLTEQGYTVFVPVDGVVSRRDDHRDAGLALCGQAGAVLTTTETLVFDWLAQAGTPEFKAISALVK